jgi:Domain of unknown function (DU1801)
MSRSRKAAPAFQSALLAQTFEDYPASMRERLLSLRALIFEVASEHPAVGELEEALKWGEPAYLTSASKSGSTIRIAWKAKQPDQVSMYFNCQTNLVETFRTLFPSGLQFVGNREIVLPQEQKLPRAELALCIEAALTYHLRRGKKG